MHVLLTGGTGLLGSHVARCLVASGHTVRVLVRETSTLTNLEDLEVERVVGDVTDRGSLGPALAGCDALCHTAGAVSWSPLERERIFRVNVEGTRNLVEEAFRKGVRRAVVTASVAAVGGTKTPVVLDERARWDLGDLNIAYMSSKHEGERVALQAAARGLHVCSVCPGFITGPGDIYGSSSGIVLQVVRGKMPGYVDGGTSVADVRDVAAGHVAALERGRPGDRYLLGGENLSMAAFMQKIASVSGVSVPKRIPYAVGWVAGAFADLRSRMKGRALPLSRNLIRASSLYTFASSAKAARELGYKSRPVEESLRDTLRYYLEVGKLRPATPELQALASDRWSL